MATNIRKKPTKTEAQKQWTRKRIRIITVMFIVLVVLYELVLGNNLRFYTRWIACGQRPVASDTELHVDASQPRYYKLGSVLPVTRGWAKFYCTPKEAEEAGLSASPNSYSFPHLEQK